MSRIVSTRPVKIETCFRMLDPCSTGKYCVELQFELVYYVIYVATVTILSGGYYSNNYYIHTYFTSSTTSSFVYLLPILFANYLNAPLTAFRIQNVLQICHTKYNINNSYNACGRLCY